MRAQALSLMVAAIVSAPALAGTIITEQVTTPHGSGTSVSYLEADRVRVEKPGMTVIFRADQNSIYRLDPAQKTFVRLTLERIKAIGAALQAGRAQLSKQVTKQLQSMPPDQRARAEVGLAVINGSPMKLTFRKTGATAIYGKWRCERIDKLLNGKPLARLCVAPLSELGLSRGDIGVLSRFQDFMRQGMPQLAVGSSAGPEALEKAVGYPALPVHTEAQGMQIAMQSTEKKELAADLFEVPSGYREVGLSTRPH